MKLIAKGAFRVIVILMVAGTLVATSAAAQDPYDICL